MSSFPSRPTTAASPCKLDDLLALDGADFVRAAYQALLRRDPDPKGFVDYLDQLAAGVDRLQIVHEIRWSPEGQVCGATIVGLAGSDPAAADADQGGATLDALLRRDGADFVAQAYALLLGREADASGLAHYSARLVAGEPRLQILAEISASDEFRRRNRQLPGLDAALQQHRRQHGPLRRGAGTLARRLGATARRLLAPPAAAPRPGPPTAAASPAAGDLPPAANTGISTVTGPDTATAQAATPASTAQTLPAAAPTLRPLRAARAAHQWLLTQPALEDREGWRLP